MSYLRTSIRFLGSIRFTVFLIAAVTLMVIAGTFAEAYTDSHRYAAALTYDNPFFEALLLGFFLNILISALLRWPFRLHHVPFLLTHLGLLMIITGAAVKGRCGVQGTTALLEGAGTSQIFMTNTYEILLENRDCATHYPIQSKAKGFRRTLHADRADTPTVRLLGFTPHGTEHVETWIKHTAPSGKRGIIAGLTPLPVAESNDSVPPAGARARVFPGDRPAWTFYAAEVEDIAHTAKRLIKDALAGNGEAIDITLSVSPAEGIASALARVDGLEVDLLTTQNLRLSPLPAHLHPVQLSPSPFVAFLQDLAGDTHLLALDETGHLYSELYTSALPKKVAVYDDGYSGYGIHRVLPFSPLPHDAETLRNALLLAIAQDLRQTQSAAIPLAPPLQLLEAACKRAGADFPNTTTRLLDHWYQQGGWLYTPDGGLSPTLSRVLNEIQWAGEDKVATWSAVIFADIERGLAEGVDLMDVLRERQWPLLETLAALRSSEGPCTPDELPVLFEAITKQLYGIADHLPDGPQTPQTAERTLQRLTVELRGHGIHLSAMGHDFDADTQEQLLKRYIAANAFALRVRDSVGAGDAWSEQRLAAAVDEATISEQIETLETQTGSPVLDWKEWIPPVLSAEQDPSVHDLVLAHPGFNLETPITLQHKAATPARKLEDNLPLVTIEVQEGDRREQVTLAYDKYGTGLKWPVLDGQYVVRFQPRFQEIPYRLRLRDARQINYANTNQAFSYEADMLFQQVANAPVPATISMNNVHETWDGYRFYLANITPPTEAEVQQAQIVVNLDPAKYRVTYPGGIILTVGILLLFTRRRARNTPE